MLAAEGNPATKPEGPQRDFSGDIKVDNKIPTKSELEKASERTVYDKDGKKHTFRDLVASSTGSEPRRVLVIFIRHFFCGVRLPFSPFASHPRPSYTTTTMTNTAAELSGVPALSVPINLRFLPCRALPTHLSNSDWLRHRLANPELRDLHLNPLSGLCGPFAQTLRYPPHDSNPLPRRQSPRVYAKWVTEGGDQKYMAGVEGREEDV